MTCELIYNKRLIANSSSVFSAAKEIYFTNIEYKILNKTGWSFLQFTLM